MKSLASRTARALSAAAFTTALLITGCGSSTQIAATPIAAPSAAALNGNWLITGSLPFGSALSGPPNATFGIAMTFSATGAGVVGGGSTNVLCGLFVADSGQIVSGSVAADGTFTFANSLTPLPASPTLQLTGTVPASGAASFSGTYTYTNPSATCPLTQTTKYTATRIADVTGTYTGTANLSFTNALTATIVKPVALSLALQQGGVVPGTSAPNADLLTGSLTAQGAGCFTKGTSSATPTGVLGVQPILNLTLDDGSTMHLLANIEDATATHLLVNVLTLSGGTCGSVIADPFELVRQ